MSPEYHHSGDGPLRNLPNEIISIHTPFCSLIFSVILIVYSLLRIYILEGGLLQRLYGDKYSRLSDTNRRVFLNHHIAGITKLLILIFAAYPFLSVAFTKAHFQSPYTQGSKVTMGDILMVASQMLMGMYAFELMYRVKVPLVSVVHHICTIAVGQTAIAINLTTERYTDGTVEFLLCCIWGAFDIVAEFFPHLTIILYRIYPNKHSFLAKIFLMAASTTLTGTITETIIAMYFFGSCWDAWSLAFKILTPILHAVFTAAQLHGTWILFKLWLKEKRLLSDEEKRKLEPRATSVEAYQAFYSPKSELEFGIPMRETILIGFERGVCA